MINTSRQLKDLIRNLSKESGIEVHVLIRKYKVMEIELLPVRLPSPYDGKIFRKGL